MTQKSSATATFVIEDCILSYPHLFQPQQIMGQGTPKYSAVLLVTPEVATVVYQKAQELAAGHFRNGEQQQPNFAWPLIEAKQKPAYATNPRLSGLYVINTKASADYPPQVVGPDRQKILDRGQIYAGCIVAAGIRLYTYNNMGNTGIGVGLSAIMKQADGEPLAGDAVDPESLFKGVQAQAPAAGPLPGGAPAPAPAQTGNPAPNFGMPTPPFLS